ncbi:MAG: phage holin family protein [Elusimicrobia bacterium]|nr:phage holin family protein [Elusimicrobiota bacterium]MDE2425382.1 phage holin family protein [Elusimicrobiota bacterium]
MRVLVHLLLSAVAVFVAARLLPGAHVDSFSTALVVAVVLGLVNAVLKPILLFLTLPINILTLGLFTFVVIGGCVLLVAYLVPGFYVDGFGWALAFAFVLWVLNGFLHALE